ncbi:MAG TPA: IS3 family transposase, partial [Longimicrobiaceae bacterium]|nr:IS3 family transposase [Longimicrobiaceae bacterium]
MRYACIEEHRASYDVAMMCRVLEVARSGYYKWRACSGRERRVSEMRLLLEIRAAHLQSRGRYGAPRIWRELRERGVACSRGQVERLMRQDRLRGKSNRPQRRRKVVEEQAVGLVAENLLARRFSPEEAGGLNRVWVSDITYIPTRQGWLYLVLILDLASRRVVGWAMGAAQNTALVLDALEMAVQSRRPAPGLILHSDQGCQYTSRAYQDRLAKHGMRCSMSRRGTCLDNAVAESAFATLECELIEGADWHTHAEARQ